ncbi:hypothetical protein E2C01_083085 [Portunus trituberculatus]|uniref:Uncharacterized protein n=1 Tax=Portunus trituberculatus TaxID=210409 RepID=A0A5B7J5G4_PORTR|nr:hypothetical protein [Portunus trituberculatus]
MSLKSRSTTHLTHALPQLTPRPPKDSSPTRKQHTTHVKSPRSTYSHHSHYACGPSRSKATPHRHLFSPQLVLPDLINTTKNLSDNTTNL